MTKADRSPVTISDYGAQAIICKMLKEAFPDDPVVAEEDAKDLRTPEMKRQLAQVTKYVQQALANDSNAPSSVQEEDILSWIDHGNGKPSNKKRFWTLDPIDGTKGFLRGDQYAVCLACIEDGIVQHGIIACPSLELGGETGHLFIADRGNGAWSRPLNVEDGTQFSKLQVSKDTHSVVQSFEASHGNHTAQEAVSKSIGIENIILMDSQAKYAMVASGQASLYLRLSSYKENIWDHAAGLVLVEEAGGSVTDRNGKPLGFAEIKMTQNNGVVVSNGIIHEKVILTLRDYKD
eukprot:scaffold24711_cov122-Cylindrotheca_fusiformis.AAC.1